jgi:hypothetical protein
MPPTPDQRYDFFLSRRGSVAAVAREVADGLTDKETVLFIKSGKRRLVRVGLAIH